MEHRKRIPCLKINRESDPFVFTNEMKRMIEYTIKDESGEGGAEDGEGERQLKNYDMFQDLCCKAYEIVRSNSTLFFNLLKLMMSSGI